MKHDDPERTHKTRKYEMHIRVRRAKLAPLIAQYPQLGVPAWTDDTEAKMRERQTVCPGCQNPETYPYIHDPKRPHHAIWICLRCRRAWGPEEDDDDVCDPT